jgi:hypothetical protein
MKKDFAQLIKEMRTALRPEFHSIIASDGSQLTSEQLSQSLMDLETKTNQMIVDNGYTKPEFDQLCREHFMDFSSNNPDEWVIKHDPENAQIISGN